MGRRKKKRIAVPEQAQSRVLFLNEHTCCVCNNALKAVLLHHINEDPSDNRVENLAVVCLECSEKIHRKSPAAKGYSSSEVALYKEHWEQCVAKRREFLALPVVKETVREIDLSSGVERHIEREGPYVDGLALRAFDIAPRMQLSEGEDRALREARRVATESGSAERLFSIAARLRRDKAAVASREMILSRICLAIGDAKFQEADYASAERHYQEALGYAESADEPAIRDICLSELAAAVGMQGRHEQALVHLDRLLALNPDDPAAWYNKGICLLALKRLRQAQLASSRAIELAREAEAWDLVARSYLNLGVAHDRVGDPEKAIESYENAIRTGGDADEWGTVAKAQYNAGKACEALGNHVAEIEYYQKAIEIGASAGEWSTVADAYGNLGAAQLQFGKVREATESWRMAVEFATKGQDWRAAGDAWFRLGLVHAQEGEYEEALKAHMKAVDCSTRSMQWLGVAKGWYGAGLAQAEMGDHESATKSYSQAIEAALRVERYELAAAAWLQLGGQQLTLERYQEALACGEDMMECATKARDWDGVAGAHNLIALAHSGLDHYAEALASFEKAIEVGTENEAWVRVSFGHYGTGLVHRELGAHHEALGSWRKALELSPFLPENGAPVFRSMAESICFLGTHAVLEGNIQRARQQARALAAIHFDAQARRLGQLVLDALAAFGESAPHEQGDAFVRFRQLVMDTLNQSSP